MKPSAIAGLRDAFIICVFLWLGYTIWADDPQLYGLNAVCIAWFVIPVIIFSEIMRRRAIRKQQEE